MLLTLTSPSKFFSALIMLTFVTLITFSPSIRLIPYIESHDAQRIFQLCLLALVLLRAAAQIFNPAHLIPIRTNVRIGCCVLLLLACFSSSLAVSPRQSVIEVSIFIALCYLTLYVAKQYQEDSATLIKYLLYALWVSLLLYLLSFYVGYIAAMVTKRPLHWPQPFYGFSNIRLFQQYQLGGLGLICLPLLAFKLHHRHRIWIFIALTFWWVLLFYGGSRGVILAWLVAIVLTALMYQKSAWPFLRIQLTNAITGLAAYFILLKLIPPWVVGSSINSIRSVFTTSASGRFELWQDALEMVSNAPFFGVGPMNYYWHSAISTGTYPHNSILQTASEFGLPATFIILTILGYGAFCWFGRFRLSRLKNESILNKNLTVILFFSIIANATYALFSGVTVMPISQTLLFTTIGLMVGQYITASPPHNTATNNIRFRPIFALIVLTAMIYATLPELVRGLTSYQRPIEQYERAFSIAPNTINPRIWMQQNRPEHLNNKVNPR